jgi:diketogulonate reductase-like aldo/keto reductase
MEKIDPIVAELRRIGERHDNRTPSQVALRWIIEKGAVPIPGAKNGDQAAQNAGALGWSLDDDDMRSLDDVCLEGQRTIKQRMWQHG